MTRFLRIAALVVFTLALTSIANAQASRTWVSGVGDDANPCSRTAPCKTFAGAISKTAACGEIDALDPGGFGAVTITKSITIDGTGTFASILASLTNGIIINAATTDVITIRGISINGFCNGLRGIDVLAAKTVNIEDCVIFRFGGSPGTGVDVNATNNVRLNIRNSVIRDNGGDGIVTTTTSGLINVNLDNVSSRGNGTGPAGQAQTGSGVHAKNNSRVNARNCNFSNNNTDGVFADGISATSVIRVWASQISTNNGNGVQAGNTGNTGISVVEIGLNQINNNAGSGATIGAGGAGTAIDTFSNNSIRGNGADGCGGCTPVGPGS